MEGNLKKITLAALFVIGTASLIGGEDRTVTEVEQLKLDKTVAEMQNIQLQFQLLKEQEQQLQGSFAGKQQEFQQAEKGIFERLKVSAGEFQLQQEQKDGKKIWVVKAKETAKEKK